MGVVCLCVQISLIDKYTDGSFSGGSHPPPPPRLPSHLFLEVAFSYDCHQLYLKKQHSHFGSDFYEFFFAHLTMQISIKHHFKECEKENSLIKTLFMKCLILVLHRSSSLRETNADF